MKKLLCLLALSASVAWAGHGIDDSNWKGPSVGNTSTFVFYIPHRIGAFLPITDKQNMCYDCHNGMEAKGKIPKSHYLPDGKLDERRYVCTLCHAPWESNEK